MLVGFRFVSVDLLLSSLFDIVSSSLSGSNSGVRIS